MTQACPDCASTKVLGGGNGKCSACYGGGKAGSIADDVAGGKRNCEQCDGTGQCRTCHGTGTVAAAAQPSAAQRKRPHANDELNPFDDKVAIRVVCPNCGAQDWFEWKFLGHLTDPVCGHSWYAGSGTYALMQIRAAFSLGRKYAKHTTSGVSGGGAWLAKPFFWFVNLLLGLGVRLEFGILMIPIQALAGLFQTKRNTADAVTRLGVLAVTVALVGFGIYKLQHSPPRQVSPAQSSAYQPTQTAAIIQPNQPSTSAPAPVVATQQVLLNNSIESSRNWLNVAQQGITQLTWLSPQPLEMTAQATNPGSGQTLYTAQIYPGHLHVTFVFDHQGFGRTTVGLWSVATNNWGASAVLDTDDTNYLNFSAGGTGTEYKYSGSQYMNRWTTIDMRIVGSTGYFYVDGAQLAAMPMMVQGPFRVAVGVGSVSWKSGPNDTLFSLITASSN